MVDIKAEIICDSIGSHSPRLTTFLTRYPKFIHAEHMRHRSGSYCVSSSRAVPVSKNLEEVRFDKSRAGPVYWGSEQKGMQSGQELSEMEKLEAQSEWRRAALSAANHAENMLRREYMPVHKSIVNRLLEPFLHVNVLYSTCEPGLLNFLGLRLDKSAQPEIRALAEAIWKAWNESTPKKLQPGQWHLPFADDAETFDEILGWCDGVGNWTEELLKVSTARCARLSYTSFETGRRSTIEEDLKLYDRLVGAHPIHASPAEHQATPDVATVRDLGRQAGFWMADGITPVTEITWRSPELHGNLPGWIQFRKTLPNEAVAPLPEGYSR